MEKLAAVLANEMHLGCAATGTCVTVLKFVVLFCANDLDHPCFLEPTKIPVNGTQRDFGQTLRYFGSLENTVRIFDHIVQNHLSSLSLVFHFTIFLQMQTILKLKI